MANLRIGIDTGGTFTDFVVIRDGTIEMFKELSTPHAPEQAIVTGMSRIATVPEVIHGSTVATNALLERKGAKTALLTTEGFEDVLVIGRQTRRELYNINVTRPDPLVKESLRLGVRERVLYDGSIETALDISHLRSLVERLRLENVQSVAVSLLFSFANPEHERTIRRELEPVSIPVSLSSEVMPEYREYERTSTTVINAYLAPMMSQYLRRLRDRLGSELRVMQSNGGAVQAETAASEPVRTILSGPAGGVVGAFHVAALAGYKNIITFDMGGTSTDVALCEGDIKVTHESQVDGMPVGIPMMDIHTVGAGGGSIAHLDPGGALRVGSGKRGRRSGSDLLRQRRTAHGDRRKRPFGPTSAALLPRRGHASCRRADRTGVAKPGLGTTVEKSRRTGAGRHRCCEQQYGTGDPVDVGRTRIRPARFVLVCFGGAGGLHAASLAHGLGIPKVVVPRFPGALSALGLLLADARKDYSRTLLVVADEAGKKLKLVFDELHRLGNSEMRSEGFKPRDIRVLDFVDLRYRGQSYELTIPLSSKFIEEFHRTHERRYGYANPNKPVEIVNVRTRFLGSTKKPAFPKATKTRSKPQAIETCPVWIGGKKVKTSIYDRDSLTHGHQIKGPAIIGEYSSTTLVPPGFICEIDALLNLILSQR